jgi:4-carboxymuconolactone decarboxylase
MTDLNQQLIAVAPEARRVTQAVTPALENYTDNVLFGTLWERPNLSKRDRSIVTLSALIALNHTAELVF